MEQDCWRTPSGLKIEGRNPESSRNPETKKTHTLGNACRHVEDLNDYRGGRRILRPSTHTQAKYHQRTGWGANPQTAERWTGHRRQHVTGRQSVVWANGGWQPALPGGTATKQKTDGEEARGGERDSHAANVLDTWRSGGGILEGGERGYQSHQWEKVAHHPKQRDRT